MPDPSLAVLAARLIAIDMDDDEMTAVLSRLQRKDLHELVAELVGKARQAPLRAVS